MDVLETEAQTNENEAEDDEIMKEEEPKDGKRDFSISNNT